MMVSAIDEELVPQLEVEQDLEQRAVKVQGLFKLEASMIRWTLIQNKDWSLQRLP